MIWKNIISISLILGLINTGIGIDYVSGSLLRQKFALRPMAAAVSKITPVVATIPPTGVVDMYVRGLYRDIKERGKSLEAAARQVMEEIIPLWAYKDEPVRNARTVLDILKQGQQTSFVQAAETIITQHIGDAESLLLRAELRKFTQIIFVTMLVTAGSDYCKEVREAIGSVRESGEEKRDSTVKGLFALTPMSDIEPKADMAILLQQAIERLQFVMALEPYNRKAAISFIGQEFVHKTSLTWLILDKTIDEQGSEDRLENNLGELSDSIGSFEDIITAFGYLVLTNSLEDSRNYTVGDFLTKEIITKAKQAGYDPDKVERQLRSMSADTIVSAVILHGIKLFKRPTAADEDKLLLKISQSA